MPCIVSSSHLEKILKQIDFGCRFFFLFGSGVAFRCFLEPFGRILEHLGDTLGDLGATLGAWGVTLGNFGTHWGHFGSLGGSLWVLLGCFGGT